MSEKNIIHPSPKTVEYYNKVNLEYQCLSLEINKLKAFLDNPKYVSERMLELMELQYKEMLNYHGTLGYRIALFEEENPLLINGNYPITKGQQIIGTFNPSGNPQVEEIKKLSAQLINAIEAFGKDPRRNAIAITDIEKAQMMAVKSIFN